MDAKNEEINLGAHVCEKIKAIFYPEKHWQSCYRDVAIQFSNLKIICRKFYCDLTDVDILKQLVRYSTEDIKEAFSNGQGVAATSPGCIKNVAGYAEADAEARTKH